MEPVFPFELALPRRGEGAIAAALRARLRAAILERRLIPGSALPSTRAAAAALGIARNTVIGAYDQLLAEGLLTPRERATPIVTALRRPLAAGRGSAIRSKAIDPRWRKPELALEPPRSLPERCFRLGIPDNRAFPHALWRRLTARVLRRLARQPFLYPPTAGLPELRAAIAQHVAFSRAVACTPEQVLVTSGSQQAFDLIARLLGRGGRCRVAVEDPGYPPLRAAFLAAGASLLPVPVDDEGLVVERLPRAVDLICVTPSHQSPTGATLSLPRRQALLEAARRLDALILEDDYDGEFRYGRHPLDALQTLDREQRVFYVGTFSKSLFPGLRKGYVVAPPWATAALTTIKHVCDSHADATGQAVLAEFIADGHLARHARRMQRLYGERRRALLGGIVRHLGEWLTPIPSDAGMHLAARVRDPRHAPRVFARALECLPGSQSTAAYAMTHDVPPAITIGYGVADLDLIGPALIALRRRLSAG